MGDYVVTRKRKRYAVDPCLGYYMYAPLNDAGEESATRSCSNMANDRIARAGVELEHTESAPQLTRKLRSGETIQRNTNRRSQGGGSNRAQSQEDNVLSVERFLKSSTRGRSAKTYRHRKLLGHQDDDRNSTDTQKANRFSRGDFILRRTSTSNEEGDKSPDRRRNSRTKRGRKDRKALKERLYEAAILTHGNPDDYYTRSEAAENMASNRVALLFVPDEHTSRGHHTPGKPNAKALLVDPRKSTTMQSASLTWRPFQEYTNSGLLSNTLDHIPLSKWNLTLADGVNTKPAMPTNEGKEAKTTGDVALMVFNYQPLKFVSFQEAEKNYKVMFSGAGDGLSLEPHTTSEKL